MVVIVDYGMGNLRSVSKACEKVGLQAEVSSDPKKVKEASALIVPGVGAFRVCISNLKKKKLFDVLKEILQKNDRPYLGLCLGLQLLFTESEEDGLTAGFGVVAGRVRKFPPPLKTPHMGWNALLISQEKNPALFPGIPNGAYVYFVHSYYVDPADRSVVAAETEYGRRFASSIQMGNIYGTQFHPEKSQSTGLQILRNFSTLCANFEQSRAKIKSHDSVGTKGKQ